MQNFALVHVTVDTIVQMQKIKKNRRKAHEIDIGMEISKKDANINRFNQLINKSIDIMQTKAENKLNPLKHLLSDEAKKRLKWMYIIHFECDKNIAKSARKIGISRQWLSTIHSVWINANKNPLSLEPESKTPKNTKNRKRINKEIEDKIIKIKSEYLQGSWGKDKIKAHLDRKHKIKVGATTVNRYLHKNGLINVKISNRLKAYYKKKKEKEKFKIRPPKDIKDYKPGALVEKDVKFIVKMGQFINTEKYKAKENFWYQHTVIDSFTRIKITELANDMESATATTAFKKCENKFPFQIACVNTDNGSENEKDFDNYLKEKNITHFYSRAGTPTDNPRVERSHLTDDIEFYNQGNICESLEKQIEKNKAWDDVYNNVRPHQALNYLTPMEFYKLYKKNPEEAYKIVKDWEEYLNKQRKRQMNSRKIKKREKIDKLIQQIDVILAKAKN